MIFAARDAFPIWEMSPTIRSMYLLGGRRLGIFVLLLGLFVAPLVQARSWPFDQRNILLARTEGHEFPDDVTVAQILDIFVQKGRVRWVMQKGGRGQILPVDVPGDFPWQSSLSVKKLGLRYKVDGIVQLQQKGTELDLQWYSVSDGEPMFFERVNLPAAGPRKEEVDMRRKRLSDFLEDIWLRIPGRGYVIKRDMTTVTIEGGQQVGVKVGDTLEIRRLEQAERHPLLKTFIGIHSTLSGLITVTSVGDPLSTGKIEYESTADPIQEGDRYDFRAAGAAKLGDPKLATGVTPSAPPLAPGERKIIPLSGDSAKAPEGTEKKEGEPKEASAISKGYLVDVSGRLGWGSLSHSESVPGVTREITGKGIGLDFAARGYMSRSWVVDGRFGFRHYNPTDVESSYGAAKLGADIAQYRLAAGYRFVFIEDPSIPGECVVSLGYQRYGFSITKLDIPYTPVGKTYSGLDFGISLKIPVWEAFYAFAGGNRMMGASLTESLTTGNATGSTVWNFDAGVIYRLPSGGFASAGIDTSSASASFTGSGNRDIAATSNLITTSTLFAAYTQRF